MVAFPWDPTAHTTTPLQNPTPQEHSSATSHQTQNLKRSLSTTYHQPTHPKWHWIKIQPTQSNSNTKS